MKRKIRIILTKKGYKVLLKAIKDWSEDLVELVINEKSCKFFGDLVFIKWDESNRYKIYQTLLIIIKTYHITYRICSYSDGIIQMDQHTNSRDENKNIPMPCIRCSFQDEKTEELLNKFKKKTVKGDDKKWDIDQKLE